MPWPGITKVGLLINLAETMKLKNVMIRLQNWDLYSDGLITHSAVPEAIACCYGFFSIVEYSIAILSKPILTGLNWHIPAIPISTFYIIFDFYYHQRIEDFYRAIYSSSLSFFLINETELSVGW